MVIAFCITIVQPLSVIATEAQDWASAYIDIISQAVANYGIAQQGDPFSEGVSYVGLIDFDNNGLPELLYAWGLDCAVYTYESGKAFKLVELDIQYGEGTASQAIKIRKDSSGISYLQSEIKYDYSKIYGKKMDGPDNSAIAWGTVINGKWVQISKYECYYLYDDIGEYIYYYIDDKRVSETEYYNYIEEPDLYIDPYGPWSNNKPYYSPTNNVESILDSLKIETIKNSLKTTVKAYPTSSVVFVNGININFEAYQIDDYNYFKLRDLAYVLQGTKKQFDVGWDSAKDAISLTRGMSYTAVGGEMTGKGSDVQNA